MIAIIGTSDQPCWLAEACKQLLLLLVILLLLFLLVFTWYFASCRVQS